MLRHLVLLRHAKSSWSDNSLSDHERPLSPRGRRAAPAMATILRRDVPMPELVYCSDAVRTRQTLDLLDLEAVPTTIERRLYLADARELVALLRETPDSVRSVLVIGHNPGLHDLAVGLAGEASDAGALRGLRAKLPTAGLVELVFDAPDWGALAPGAARLVRFVCPKDLPGAEEHRL